MVKFTANTKDGRLLIGIGLSEPNVQRLRQGEPIHIFSEELNLPLHADIMIFHGETELAMTEELKEFITTDTVIKPPSVKQ